MVRYTPEDENGPLMQDNEVTLQWFEHKDVIPPDKPIKIYLGLYQSPVFLGGIPTDPNYCAGAEGTGRKVKATAIINNQIMTERTWCVSRRWQVTDTWSKVLNVGWPDGVEPGDQVECRVYFQMGDTEENQFSGSFNSESASTVVSTFKMGDGADVPDTNLCEATADCPEGYECRLGICVPTQDGVDDGDGSDGGDGGNGGDGGSGGNGDGGDGSDGSTAKKATMGLLALGSIGYLSNKDDDDDSVFNFGGDS